MTNYDSVINLSSDQSDQLFKEWKKAFNQQPLNTRYLADYLISHKWFEYSLRKPHLDTSLSQNLSAFFLKGLINQDLFIENKDKTPEEVICGWLNTAYDAIGLHLLIIPQSTKDTVARAILNNNTKLDPSCWDVAYINHKNEIVFAEASKSQLTYVNNQYQVLNDEHPLFCSQNVLKEGFAKILSAFEQANNMEIYADVRGFDFSNDVSSITEVIRLLHKSDAERLSQGNKINLFDFKCNVLDFCFKDKATVLDTVM